MKMVRRVIATTGEVSLKGGNRLWFERKLNANARRALRDLGLERLERPQWRMLLTFAEEVPFAEVARRLGTVFGLHSFMPVEHGGQTLAGLLEHLEPHLGHLEEASFAVRCQRSDKSFPRTSVEIEREVGAFIKERTGWQVNLSSPQRTFRLLLDPNGFWFWLQAVTGPGGLPVGTGGRALCLLSGGIDSPVAAYMMMKRGMRLDFVHFHSAPRTDAGSQAKADHLVRMLNRYQGSARLATVPLLPIQEQVAAHCPASLRVLLYRRFMLRVAARLARDQRCRALVTGESLGQVSSQTIENLAAVEAVAGLPVLRPLIGLDKTEIIALARRSGTYTISILPHDDCCSLMMPDRPATRCEDAELTRAEQVLDVEGLVDSTLAAAEVERIADASGWDEVPLPRGLDQGNW